MQELKRAREIIDDVSKETDSILLFHFLSGKDLSSCLTYVTRSSSELLLYSCIL